MKGIDMSIFRINLTPIIVVLLTIITNNAAALDKIDPAKLAVMVAEDTRIELFRHMERVFPVETIERDGRPFKFIEFPQPLDISFEFRGKTQTLDEFLEKTITTNFLVIKEDQIVFEKYFRGNDRNSLATSMSVAKSFTSALIGIAIEEGHIKSVNDDVTDYVPELNDSGYNGVTIKNLLQMSSGIKYSEIYDDGTSDIIQMIGQLGAGASIVDYASKLENERKPGGSFQYASIDTNILGMAIKRATGMNPAQYLEEKIWKKIGMESDATWCTDNHGNVLTFAYLNITARDYAKFGRLYLNGGDFRGQQIVPKKWVMDSRHPDQEYLKLDKQYGPLWDIGYQHKWWIPPGNDGEFTGIGVWGQYLYVNPAKKLIIVKNSVDPDFDSRDMETVAAFRAIGDYLSSDN
jgi:hypothetical protein